MLSAIHFLKLLESRLKFELRVTIAPDCLSAVTYMSMMSVDISYLGYKALMMVIREVMSSHQSNKTEISSLLLRCSNFILVSKEN